MPHICCTKRGAASGFYLIDLIGHQARPPSARRAQQAKRRVYSNSCHGPIRAAAASIRCPGAFCLDPEGKFLFAAGTASSRLASYRVDSEHGTLTPLAVEDVGPRPAAVATVSLGD
ncbi:MAG TPA: beta-propeller fold lactonase family protein [Stellaceae bacterium]|nr:beta-propeller fold lactonase family protein [Stellaceae bacterium]